MNDSSVNTGTSAVPNPAQEVLHPQEEPNVAGENKLNWKSTVSATAKLFFRGVNESADAFGPLKSVTRGLYFILENWDVCSSSYVCYPQHLRVFQRTNANKQAMESKPFLPHSACLFLRVVSRKEKGDRTWNGEPKTSTIESHLTNRHP